jgi:uncharacterized protein (UPF0332 family)
VSEGEADWRRKSKRFLESARILVESGDFDSAAGRAYYAMFHATEALLKARGLEFKTHGALISAYGLEFAKSGELPVELHRSLIAAYHLRAQADYFSAFVVDEETARVRVGQAEEFVQAAAGWLERNGV